MRVKALPKKSGSVFLSDTRNMCTNGTIKSNNSVRVDSVYSNFRKNKTDILENERKKNMIWDKLSPFYDLFETLYNGKCFRGIARKISELVTEEDVILECACGTGLLTLPMAKKCKRLTATDFSYGMLRQTQKKVRGYTNTKLERASILELPYGDNQFDVVVAANVIHLLDDPRKALEEMQRVCKPGGRIIIPTYINETKKNAMVAAKLLAKTGVDFKRQFDIDSYKQFFDKMGIKDITYSVVEGHMPCAFAVFEN